MATRTNRPSQFGAEAPPKNLTLPEGNVTLYEQLVFLPNSVRNLDVVLRFAYNGVHQEAVSRIVEHGRVLPKDCKVNTALKIMQYGPRFRLLHIPGPGVKWTPEKAFNEDRPDNWDKTNLSWNGCRLDTLYKSGCGPVVDNVPFENLARGVKNMPTGYDALDLTRCVEVAQKSPGVYKFPRDFPAILQQLGGPAVVRYGNLDAAVARRYTRNSVVFKRHLEAGLITDPDDKLVARAVPDTTTIGNSSFSSSTISSSAADKASSNDGVNKTSGVRLAATSLSTDIGTKIPGIGRAVQVPTGEIHMSPASTSPSSPRPAFRSIHPKVPSKSTLAGVRKATDGRLAENMSLSPGIVPKISGVGHAVQSPPSEIQASHMPTSPSTLRLVTSNTRSTFPRKSTFASVRDTSDSRPTEAALLSTGISPKISGVGHAFQSPTSEMQGLPVPILPISPTPPLRMTGDRSMFPNKSTQRRKHHPPGSVSHSNALPTLPVNQSLKRRRVDNDTLSADDSAKRLKRDYYQDSDYDIVDPDYLLFKDSAATVSYLVRSSFETPSQPQSYPSSGLGEDPTDSGIAPSPNTFQSISASKLQDDESEEDFLASVSTLW